MQKCFEVQDIPLLQSAIAKMPEEEARYHMKRCIDSGLWVPDAKAKETEASTDNTTTDDASEESTETPDPE